MLLISPLLFCSQASKRIDVVVRNDKVAAGYLESVGPSFIRFLKLVSDSDVLARRYMLPEKDVRNLGRNIWEKELEKSFW